MAEIDSNIGNAIKAKFNKVLQIRLDSDKDTLESIEDLAKHFTENTVQNRRNLRNEIEQRNVVLNKNFLEAFRKVNQTLNSVCEEIDVMNNSVTKMKMNLKSSQALTHDLIQRTNSMQNECHKLKLHHQIAEAFLDQFQLNCEEHMILYGKLKDSPITPEFFSVLDRAKEIRSNCCALLQSGYQTAASDVMDEMTLHQEGALERLYRWTQNHCRNLDNNAIGNILMESMNRLQTRPVLFKYVFDEFTTARRAILLRLFIDALTVGGPGGNPKPIEHHAHDSKRYIGDMFAFLHQAITSEKENLLVLVKKCDQSDLSQQIQTALLHIADGVCHPLKVRVETILNSEKDAIVLFTISNLLRFYISIMSQVIKKGNLEKCIIDLQKYSKQAYLNSIAVQVKNILHPSKSTSRDLDPPQRDLLPPKNLGRLLTVLKEILSVASMVEGRKADIIKIVSCVIDPLLQHVQESASHLPSIDMAVYLLNCLYHMQNAIAVYEYMDERIERLQAQSDAQIDTLISEQASSLVTNLNLGPIYTILQLNQSQIDANLLKVFMDKLNTFVTMPDILLLPQVNLLLSSTHRTLVRKKSFNVIIAIYKQIHEKISDPQSGFSEMLSTYKTPQQISEMLSR